MVIRENIFKKIFMFLFLGSIGIGFAQAQDTDADGVTNDRDLCPGTPSGTIVNAYGCPTTLTTCDYTTSSFTTNIVGTVPTETRYLLVNSSTGILTQINTTPNFSGLTGTNTYMVLAYSYTGTATGLTVGTPLSAVSATCQDFSNALVVKVCVASVLPTLSIPPTLLVNENAGTATITISLSSASTTPVTVNYTTSNGTAQSGSDFTTTTGTVTFAAGETTKTIVIPITNDSNLESTEDFTVIFSDPSGVTISNVQTTVSIINNAPNVDTDGDGVTNDRDLCPSTPSGTIVNAYGCPTTLTTCDYTTSSFTTNIVGTVPTETRYLLVNSSTGILTQINTTPNFSGLTGTNTYMVLAYSYTGTATGLTVGTPLSAVSATCQDFSNALVVKVCVASVLPTLSIPPTLLVNENAGTATITISLSSASTTPVTVNYTTSNGTAQSGSDFTTTTGTVTFAAGETTKTIVIPITDDLNIESTENFTVSLSNPSGATIANAQTTVSIIDNDVNLDTDGDGVTNDKDLCPNTPSGTIVNAYGCPTSLATCDYNTASFSVISQTPPTGKITRYVLADATDGKIIQVSLTPSFTGLTGSKTYMVLAYSYENDNTIVNLTPNNFLNQVSAACADWSNALMVKVCAPFIDNGLCDYTTSSITLNTVSSAPANGLTQYVLVNSSGTIVNVSNSTTFTGLSGTNVYNAYAISYTGSVSGVTVGGSFSNVTGTCFDWSNPLSIRVCVCKPSICLPITIVKRK